MLLKDVLPKLPTVIDIELNLCNEMDPDIVFDRVTIKSYMAEDMLSEEYLHAPVRVIRPRSSELIEIFIILKNKE